MLFERASSIVEWKELDDDAREDNDEWKRGNLCCKGQLSESQAGKINAESRNRILAMTCRCYFPSGRYRTRRIKQEVHCLFCKKKGLIPYIIWTAFRKSACYSWTDSLLHSIDDDDVLSRSLLPRFATPSPSLWLCHFIAVPFQTDLTANDGFHPTCDDHTSLDKEEGSPPLLCVHAYAGVIT